MTLFRKKYNLQKNIPVITIVGRIRRLKGQDYFIKALSKIKGDFRALIVGGGDGGEYEKSLYNLVRKYKLRKRVFFVGATLDTPEFYKLSTVVVSATSTKPETFGLTTLEAMAMGVPVVATAHGGSLELIKSGKTGFFAKPCNSKNLASAIKKVLKLSDAKYRLMQKECVSFAKRFSRDKMCKKVLDVYRDISNGK